MNIQEFFDSIPKLKYDDEHEELLPPSLFKGKGQCWEQALYIYSLAIKKFPRRDVKYIFTAATFDLTKTEGIRSYTTHATVGIKYEQKFYWLEPSWPHAYGIHDSYAISKVPYRSFDDIAKDIHRIHRVQSDIYSPLMSNPDVDVEVFLKAKVPFDAHSFTDTCVPPEMSYQLANTLVMNLPLAERQMLMPRHPDKYVNTPLLLHRSLVDNLGLLVSPNDKYGILAFCDVCKCSTPRQVLLTSVAVDPHYRQGGLGSLAVQYAIDWCKLAGYKSILYGSLPDNEPSIRLAQKLGFKINDKESTDTDVVLELKL